MRVSAAASAPAAPPCYACEAAATTRCQSCGILSCAQHLDSIFVEHGKGGANELRCSKCYSSAVVRQVATVIFGAIVIAVLVFVIWPTKRAALPRDAVKRVQILESNDGELRLRRDLIAGIAAANASIVGLYAAPSWHALAVAEVSFERAKNAQVMQKSLDNWR